MSNPYNYHKGEAGYQFETDNEVRYVAYFIDYTPLFGEKWGRYPIYNFSIEILGEVEEQENTRKIATDPRIASTICKILLEFFAESSKNVAVAVYDNTDARRSARERKFKFWYSFANPGYIEKHDFLGDAVDYDVSASILFHTENSDKHLILELFERIVKNGMMPVD